MPANPSNNSAATATNLLLSEGLSQTVSGSLGSTDLLDFYKFSTTAASNLKLSLNGLTGNATLNILQADGTTALPAPAGTGNTSNISNDGKLSESFVFNNLPAGNYVIRVEMAAGTTAADYNLEAIANKAATANSILWKQPGAENSVFWQLNGPNLSGDAITTPVGYEYVGSGDFDGLSDAGGKSQDILWRRDLGNGNYELNIWFMNSDNSLRESKPVVLNASDLSAFAVPNAFQIQRIEDFDGDGKSDILFRQTAANSVVLWKMDGATVNLAASKNYTAFDPAFEIFGTGDFDNNGIRDILFRNATSGGFVVVWLLDANLNLIVAPAGQTNGPSQSGLLKFRGATPLLTADWSALGVTDFNKNVAAGAVNPSDDRDDILFLNRNSGALVSWLMNGSEIQDGGFILNGTPISGTPGNFDLVGLGDLNGDGNGDMLWRPKSKTGALVAWQMEGKDINLGLSGLVASDATPTTPFALAPNFEIITRNNVAGERSIVDFDGNKRADIYFRETGSGVTVLWSMNGKTYESAKSGAVKLPDGTVPSVPLSFIPIGGLTTQLASIPQGTAGASVSTAYNLGTLEGLGNYQDTLAGTASDFFTFKLEKTSDVTVALSPAFGSTVASTTAQFTLLERTGVNPDGTPILTPRTLTAGSPIAAGTYFIEVKKTAAAGATTPVNYNLRVTGEPSTINLRAVALTSVTATSATFQGTVAGAIRLADLVGVSPQTPDSDKPKATIDIAYTVTNTEPKATGAVNVRFYLSRVSTINPADTRTVVLGTDTITQVPGNGASTTKVFANVALPPGDNNFWTTDTNYYIGYEIDPVSAAQPQGLIQETFETANPGQTDNNVFAPSTTAGVPGTLTVAIQNTQTPDLLGVGLAATGSTTIARGGTLALTYTVRNGGKKSTGDATPSARFYLYRPSTDANLTPEQQNSLDITDSTRTIALGVTDDNALFLPTNIGGETTAAATPVSVILPGANSAFWTGAAAGTPYFIGMVVDAGETIAESDELNNSNRGLGQDRLAITVA
jgi:Bacterial pre-peptidase C-terminal domain